MLKSIKVLFYLQALWFKEKDKSVWRYEGNNAIIYACLVCGVTLQIIKKKISAINWRTYYPQLKLLCKAHIRGTSSAGDSQLTPIIINKNQAANALPWNLIPQWQRKVLMIATTVAFFSLIVDIWSCFPVTINTAQNKAMFPDLRTAHLCSMVPKLLLHPGKYKYLGNKTARTGQATPRDCC